MPVNLGGMLHDRNLLSVSIQQEAGNLERIGPAADERPHQRPRIPRQYCLWEGQTEAAPSCRLRHH